MYTIKRNDTGFWFELTENGETIATSIMYTAKASCYNGIESVRKNAIKAPVEDHTKKCKHPKFEIYGNYNFCLKSKNGSIVINGIGYKDKESCLKEIERVRKCSIEEDITTKH